MALTKGFRKIKIRQNEEIQIRDPFIFPYEKEKKYYMFGTTFAIGAGDKEPMFEVYVGTDLKTWEGPYAAFQPPAGYWGVRQYWAPEVFEIDGAFYMFATFKGGIGVHRGTAILRAEHPAGPYIPHSDGPVTPPEWECLDGTYYEDEEGQRWLVFCHEWTQIYNGKIKAIRLQHDLRSACGEAIDILEAGEMKWIRPFRDESIEKEGFLTDGPFMYRAKDGELLLLWSSYSKKGYSEEGFGAYTVAIARSRSGRITGPWSHDEKLLLDRNTGHCSLFRSFENQLMISAHYPDRPLKSERPLFLPLEETEDGLCVSLERQSYEK